MHRARLVAQIDGAELALQHGDSMADIVRHRLAPRAALIIANHLNANRVVQLAIAIVIAVSLVPIFVRFGHDMLLKVSGHIMLPGRVMQGLAVWWSTT